MPNDAETEDLVQGYLAAAAAGDLDRVWTFYVRNIIYEDTSVHQIYHGIEATKAFYTETMGGLDVHWVVDEVYATATGFAIGGYMEGRHVHDLPGMPATGKTYRVACASMADVRHGRITRNRDFWNNADLLAQLRGATASSAR